MITKSEEQFDGIGDSLGVLGYELSQDKLMALAKQILDDDNYSIRASDDKQYLQYDTNDDHICMTLVINASENNLNMISLFPQTKGLKSDESAEITIDEIIEYPQQEAVICGTLLSQHENNPALNFFVSDYIINKHLYEVGKTFKFNLSALAYSFKNRDSGFVKFTTDEGPMKGEDFDTSKLVSIMSSSDNDLSTIYAPFTGFERAIHKIAYTGNKYKTFIFNWQPYDSEDSWVKLPIYVPMQLLESFEKKRGAPVDIRVQIQGYLSEQKSDA